jgi:hypothetical protein
MIIADPVALCDPGPQFSEHRETNRERQGKEQSRDRSGNPTVFDRWIPAPDHPCSRRSGEAVQQYER